MVLGSILLLTFNAGDAVMAKTQSVSEFYKIKAGTFTDHSTTDRIKMLLICEHHSIHRTTPSARNLEFVFDDYAQAERILGGVLAALRESFPECR